VVVFRSVFVVAVVGVVLGGLIAYSLRTKPPEVAVTSIVEKKVAAATPAVAPPAPAVAPVAKVAPAPLTPPPNPDAKIEAITDAVDDAIERNQPATAVEILEKEVAKDPDNFILHANLGMIQSRFFKNDAQATPHLKKALEANAENGEVLKELVTIYTRNRKFGEAHKFLDILQDKFPDNHKLDLARAEIYDKQGRTPDAIGAAQHGAENPTSTPEVHDNLAYHYKKLGDEDKARENYDEYLRQKAAAEARAAKQIPTH
jgi:predicted Zn-dependent protease